MYKHNIYTYLPLSWSALPQIIYIHSSQYGKTSEIKTNGKGAGFKGLYENRSFEIDYYKHEDNVWQCDYVINAIYVIIIWNTVVKFVKITNWRMHPRGIYMHYYIIEGVLNMKKTFLQIPVSYLPLTLKK